VTIGRSGVRTTDFAEEEVAKVRQQFATKIDELSDEHDDAEAQVNAATSDESYKAAVATLANYRHTRDQIQKLGTPILGGLLVLVLLLCLTRMSVRGIGQARVAALTALTCGLLLAVGIATQTSHWSSVNEALQ